MTYKAPMRDAAPGFGKQTDGRRLALTESRPGLLLQLCLLRGLCEGMSDGSLDRKIRVLGGRPADASGPDLRLLRRRL